MIAPTNHELIISPPVTDPNVIERAASYLALVDLVEARQARTLAMSQKGATPMVAELGSSQVASKSRSIASAAPRTKPRRRR
jgi:hypothetical protein